MMEEKIYNPTYGISFAITDGKKVVSIHGEAGAINAYIKENKLDTKNCESGKYENISYIECDWRKRWTN